ncbi:hypothetical protein T08_15786, partial [Trichinella sp. T8]
MDYIINIELVHNPALMALPSIGPEICVASLITAVRYNLMIVIVAYIVNIVDFRWFSDTSHKSGSACCHQCV